MKKVLIKCGGSILDELSHDFFSSLHELKKSGYEVVIVHGGGPDINKMLEKLNVTPEYENGLRKTNEETLQVVEMVLSGQTNRKLVQLLESHQLKAFGIHGSDNGILQGELIDQKRLGFVGEVKEVNDEIIHHLLQKNLIPVITPIATNKLGQKLNVNADYAAAAVAHALGVEHCIFVTDVVGILIDGELARELTTDEVEDNITNGKIYGGMIPKVQSALAALEKGISSVMVVSGNSPFYQQGKWLGTKIKRKEVMTK
ncbi:acetylglutamate kinase [Bacillus sp. 31A1R]|uniref:Acetylglutamate kinase n=1 Tax=Robertmurraya mangrovi TaxID=3098077 RepID=A0ABU5IT79_9BACI|nr:acetylglutamate kinase [Bacillus sp. 31A1R]MDZ5470321.1 acetylglutamate kinase [Bacillus sp. 31A1R]